jgi:exodeoxyribonuclease V alpha subunit
MHRVIELDLFPDQQSDDDSLEQKHYDLTDLFDRLSRSKFRASFYLNAKDRAIIQEKGLETIRHHAKEIIAKRLAPAVIPNDGKQTPMRHGTSPVFLAQHATACCCRQCFYKWHHIPPGRELTKAEQHYAVEVIMEWIKRQLQKSVHQKQ